MSGGNEIQSVALEQSGGAPTNRIQTAYPARTNVALAANGATATASSTLQLSGWDFGAAGAINGDRKGTNWGGGGGWADGTPDSFPDWIQVSFNGSKTINEIDVFTLQDNYTNPVEPTQDMTATTWGLVDFQVQYWNGSSWQIVPGGSVTGNNKVWRKFTFSDITTDKIRVNVTNSPGSYSRVTEIEAYQSSGGAGTYVYDAAGNVTNDGAHSYTYDAENRLVSVDGGATSQCWYDHQNRRVKKVAGGATTLYVWEGSHVIAEHDGNVGTYANPGSSPYGVRSCAVDDVYAGSRLVTSRHYTPNCVYQYGYPTTCRPTWTDRYYVSDIWSTRLVLDAYGNVIGRMGHLPFGEEFAESGTQEKHHFTSYETEGESGTDSAINRQYSPNVARFQQADPYQASDYQVNPQSWNRYAYVENDPIHNVDPSGLFEGVPGTVVPDPCTGGAPDPPPAPDPPARCDIHASFWGHITPGVPLSFWGGSQDRGPSTRDPEQYAAWNVEISFSVSDDVSKWKISQKAIFTYSGWWRVNGKPRKLNHSETRDPDPVIDAITYPREGSLVGNKWRFWVDAPGGPPRNPPHGAQLSPLDGTLEYLITSSVTNGRTTCSRTWHVILNFVNGNFDWQIGPGHSNAWEDL